MSVAMEYRTLMPEDAERVAALHRLAVPEGERDMTVFGSPRLEAYLGALLAFPEFRGEHLFLGAVANGELMAYCHCRSLPNRWHLNYIAVHPAHQCRGVGRELWGRWLERGRQAGAATVSLDVLPSNARAAEWYRRRGLRTVSTTWMCYAEQVGTGAPGDPAGLAQMKVLGWEDAEAWQQAYGFSRFRVEIAGRAWDVGRLPAQYVTVADEFPARLYPVITMLCPGRRMLVTTMREEVARRLRVARESQRMEATLAEVV